jgi:hypothetical protein
MKLELKIILAITTVCSLVYILLLIAFPGTINHTPEYQWHVIHHGVVEKMIPAAAAMAVIIWIIISVGRGLQREESRIIKSWHKGLVIFLCGLALQIITMSTLRMGLLEFPLRIYLPDHTSYFTDAVKIKSPERFLAEFPENSLSLNTHSRTHPPLTILIFKALNRTAEALPGFVEFYNRTVPRSAEAQNRFNITPAQVAGGGLAALIILIITSLAAVMAYLAAREFLTDRAAYLAAVLFVFTPAYSQRSPVMDQVYGFFIMLSIWLLLLGLRKKRMWAGAAAGLVIGFGVWTSPVFWAGLALAGIVSASWIAKARNEFQGTNLFSFLLGLCALMAAGLLLALLGTGALLDLNYLEVFSANMKGWNFNNTMSGRVSAWMWMLFNPYEFFAWQGMPVLILCALAFGAEIRRLLNRHLQMESWFIWAVLFFGLLLDLSGRVCYEASRLAWFLVPFTCMIAAYALEQRLNNRVGSAWGLILALQLLLILAFRLVF